MTIAGLWGIPNGLKMGEDQDLSEEYILELLKQDAKKVSAGYARNGIYDVLPKRHV